MTPMEVISADAKRSGQRVGAVLHGLSVAVDKRDAKIMHDQNSVIVLDPIDGSKHDFSVHLFTADSPIGLVRSIQRLTQKVFATPGLETVYGDTKNPQVIQMLRTSGLNVQKSDKPKFTWMAKA